MHMSTVDGFAAAALDITAESPEMVASAPSASSYRSEETEGVLGRLVRGLRNRDAAGSAVFSEADDVVEISHHQWSGGTVVHTLDLPTGGREELSASGRRLDRAVAVDLSNLDLPFS